MGTVNAMVTIPRFDGNHTTHKNIHKHDALALPSGKLTVCYGNSPCLMGKSTINGHFQ